MLLRKITHFEEKKKVPKMCQTEKKTQRVFLVTVCQKFPQKADDKSLKKIIAQQGVLIEFLPDLIYFIFFFHYVL